MYRIGQVLNADRATPKQIPVLRFQALSLWAPLVIVKNYTEFQVDTFDGSSLRKDLYEKLDKHIAAHADHR